MFENLIARARARGLAFLVVGGINTLIGYVVTVGLYYVLSPAWPLLGIAAVANVICITISFSMYKLFIFKGGGSWLTEYLRCYLVYGGNAVFGMVGLWFLVDVLGVSVWLAQAVVLAIGAASSFVGHEFFTFKVKIGPTGELGS